MVVSVSYLLHGSYQHQGSRIGQSPFHISHHPPQSQPDHRHSARPRLSVPMGHHLIMNKSEHTTTTLNPPNQMCVMNGTSGTSYELPYSFDSYSLDQLGTSVGDGNTMSDHITISQSVSTSIQGVGPHRLGRYTDVPWAPLRGPDLKRLGLRVRQGQLPEPWERGGVLGSFPLLVVG